MDNFASRNGAAKFPNKQTGQKNPQVQVRPLTLAMTMILRFERDAHTHPLSVENRLQRSLHTCPTLQRASSSWLAPPYPPKSSANQFSDHRINVRPNFECQQSILQLSSHNSTMVFSKQQSNFRDSDIISFHLSPTPFLVNSFLAH